jgi:hypothetical protein
MASDGWNGFVTVKLLWEVTKEIRSLWEGMSVAGPRCPEGVDSRSLMSECGALSVLVLSKKNDAAVIPP